MGLILNPSILNWGIPSAYILHTQSLLGHRLEASFSPSDMYRHLSTQTPCRIKAKLILEQIPFSIEQTVNHGELAGSWNLLDCFEALVSAKFSAKTTLYSACAVRRMSADLMADFLDFDLDDFVQSRSIEVEFKTCLEYHVCELDAKLIASLWGNLITLLSQILVKKNCFSDETKTDVQSLLCCKP